MVYIFIPLEFIAGGEKSSYSVICIMPSSRNFLVSSSALMTNLFVTALIPMSSRQNEKHCRADSDGVKYAEVTPALCQNNWAGMEVNLSFFLCIPLIILLKTLPETS
jgi:hypothetical protein